jgi:hypothetical protein
LEEALKGSQIEKKISKIRAMTVRQLQDDVNKNLSKLPKSHRAVFVFVLNKRWGEIVATYGSLADKSYPELKKLREPLTMLGDLSGSDVHELVGITVVNETVYKDPKVEMYLIKRLTNRRLASRLTDRIRSVFTP